MKPALAQQFPTVTVDPSRLAPAHRSFNASIIEYAGRRLMAYRSHTLERKWCTLHIAELGKDWQPLNDSKVNVPLIHEDGNLEDPRLFHGPGGTLWLAWTEALYQAGNWTCVQRYGQLIIDLWKILEAFTPAYAQNNGSAKEKNWQFFWSGNSDKPRLFAIYAHSPQIVIELDGEKVINEWRTPGIHWRFGHPSGGTPPVPFNDDFLLTFFHAYRPDNKFHRRYNMAAALIENCPPFAVKFVSAEPLLTASERDPLAPDPRWNPLCVFPCGVIKSGDVWHVSSGVNDCRCAVTSIPNKRLNLAPYAMKITDSSVKIKLTGNIMLGGYCRQVGQIVEVPKQTALDLIQRQRAVLAPEEIAPVITVEESETAIIPQQPKRRRRSASNE
jgi:predicted GH43/DUF377 family glycosyl hydrolase